MNPVAVYSFFIFRLLFVLFFSVAFREPPKIDV